MGRRKGRLRVTAFVVAAACILLIVLLRRQMFPIVDELAGMQVSSSCIRIINDAINQQIAVGEIDYDMLVGLEKDHNGNISALKTNMSEVNRLKTEILDIINDRITGQSTDELGIPLGNLVLPTLLAGRGPSLPIRILSVSTSDARFENRFYTAGINQTLHQIVIEVVLEATTLTPVGTIDVAVSSQVVVAETVIVGTVPNSYVQVTDEESQTIADYIS